MDGTCLAAGTVAGEGSTGGGGGTRAEDLAEVGCFAKVDGGGCLQEIESGGVICDHQNISVKLPCVCVCLSSKDLLIFSVRISSFSIHFYVII